MLLDGHNHVGENRRASRPGDSKEIWKFRNTEPEVGSGPLSPSLSKGVTVDTSYVHAE